MVRITIGIEKLPRRSACLPFDAGPREHAYNQKQSRQTAGHKWRRSDAPHFEDARTSSFVELREHGCPPIFARLRGLGDAPRRVDTCPATAALAVQHFLRKLRVCQEVSYAKYRHLQRQRPLVRHLKDNGYWHGTVSPTTWSADSKWSTLLSPSSLFSCCVLGFLLSNSSSCDSACLLRIPSS